ncbi:fatty acid synthase alpha subunit Lsd1 [Coemansia sp. S100]|nr:fatty acid synthase alpha subunit Lsd1 [Coemansia sp. S100]
MTVMPELLYVSSGELAQSFTDKYSAAESQLLHSEDIQFFIGICKRRGQKPVPFITVLDADFTTTLVKDSIWQSENLDVIVDQDPQRVVIQQGPVATRYSTIVNEPVKDILDGVYHGHIAALLSRDYNGNAVNVPAVEYIGAQPKAATLPASVSAQVTDSESTYQLPRAQDQLPDLSMWLNALAGPTNSWLRALLTTPVIVEGSSYVDNYVPRALRPRPGQVVTVLADGRQPQSLEIVDDSDMLVLKIERTPGGNIELNIYHSVASGTTSMCYLFLYHPEQPLTPIHFVTEGHGERMRRLCMDAWIDNADVPTDNSDLIDTNCRLYSNGFVITKEHVHAFCQNVGSRSKHYSQGVGGDMFAPMDFLVVSTLPNFMRALSSTAVTNDILKILHLYNKYTIVDGAEVLRVGESVSSELAITDLVNTPIGRRAKLLINLYRRCGQKIAAIESAFLYRNDFIDIDKTFEHALDRRFTIQLATPNDQHQEMSEPAPSAIPAQPEQPSLPAATVVVEPIATNVQPSGTAASLADVPLQALDVVHALVAHKIKRSLADVSTTKSIKSLVGGKSTLQNEIVGDLHKEFGSKVPDKAEDLSLQDLASAIGAIGGGLGKHTQAQLARLFSNKMPGGFSLSSAQSTLQSAYGLGPQRQDALLLVALTMEPFSRLSRDVEAKSWLDSVAQAYAAKAGISYVVTSAGSSSGQTGAPVISSAEMEKMQQKQHEHIRQQIQVLARYAGMDLREGARLAENEQDRAAKAQAKLDSISAELGDELIDGVRPLFDGRKARRFDSSWNWVRQEAYELIQQAIASCSAGSTNAPAVVDDANLQQLKNRSSPGLLQMLAGSLSILQAANDDSLEPVIKLVSKLHNDCTRSLKQPPVYRELSTPTGPQIDIGSDGTLTYSEVPRPDELSFVDFVQHMRQPAAQDMPPFIHLKKQSVDSAWSYCTELSTMYYKGLSEVCGSGLSFAGKTALVTGCGRGSIGADIVCGLLSGGAKVIATTSSYGRKTTLFFEDMYRTHGARGSELIVVPFNQGSTGDIKQLVDYIYSDSGVAKGLGWDLSYVFPFAAVSDVGSFATNLGSHSEFAQRVLLTNVIRLLGGIKDVKERLGYVTRPSLVVLPLSPNHGIFGGDGLYGECKIGLETAFNRWESESWQDYLSIAGAVIGWTRGTGLMSGNNMVAQEVERIGVRTFSTRDMAFSILGLTHPRICCTAYSQPIWADLSGGLNIIKHIGRVISKAKMDIEQKSALLQLIARENALDYESMSRPSSFTNSLDFAASPLARHKYDFPAPRQAKYDPATKSYKF